MRKFQSLDRTARSDQSDTTLATVHQNTITGVAIFSGEKSNCSSISTCGADSQLVIWNFKLLEQSVSDLRLS
ncbi:Actin-related protein 2/3 complex subunit 1A [Portunus trituberculatus]|uniref:Actin-related protein 2/3 complex subunit 1A n=2 Tax=Portunus trituberculatus TaxID=210409 RepID=A0A5B7CSI1_PORTR|nr:Actin-related protein 2/3 complex subunit 1A [Portunus trituberculatus]